MLGSSRCPAYNNTTTLSSKLDAFNEFIDRLINCNNFHKSVVISGFVNAQLLFGVVFLLIKRDKLYLKLFSIFFSSTQAKNSIFRRGDAKSIVDITFVRDSLVIKSLNQKVYDYYSHSVYLCITHQFIHNDSAKAKVENVKKPLINICDKMKILPIWNETL